MAKNRNLTEKLKSAAPELLPNLDWLPILGAMDVTKLASKIHRELFQVGDLALAAIVSGELQVAVNWISLGLCCDQLATREALGTAGALRPSKYQYRSGKILAVLDALERPSAPLRLSVATKDYFRSIRALARLSNSVRKLDESLRRFLRRNHDRALKSVVARVDSLFMVGHTADRRVDSDSIDFYPAEELAEGASYIVHCLVSDGGVDETHFHYTADGKIARGVFDAALIKACKIRTFVEAEILVDAFDYRCAEKHRRFTITAPYPELEQSIRLGYMQNEQASDHVRLERQFERQRGAPSVFDIADKLFDTARDRVVRRMDYPVSRYIFLLPDAPPVRAMFSEPSQTVEEAFYLRGILSSELITWEELSLFEVRPGLSVLDLARVFRLFQFLSRLAMRQLSPLLADEPEIAFRSLVPVFRKGDLRMLLGWCVEEKHVDGIIELLSWSPGQAGIYDMQYRPIVSVGNHYLVPMHVAGMTNWYRNVAFMEKKRAAGVAELEAASRALSRVLREKCAFVRGEYETDLKGEHIEIDVICRFDGYLFLFECKHSLLPCNVHELRTSFKHMRTGAQQLSRAKELLSDPATQIEFYRRLQWDVEVAEKIVTCIVSCNGMFSGLRIAGNPVRRFAELSNMIETGIVRTAKISSSQGPSGSRIEANDWVERIMWNGPELTASFLHDYLQDDALCRILFDSMVEHHNTFQFDGVNLSFTTYGLDVMAVSEVFEKLPYAVPIEDASIDGPV